MKFLFSIFAISLFLSCTGGEKGEEKTEKKLTEKEVHDFILAYDEMWARKDTASLKKAMSDDYIYFSSAGSTIDKARIMGWFTPADKYKVDSATRDQVKIILNGNTAVVSTHWVGGGSFNGEKFADDQRCSLTIQKQNGELKVISEHCTQIVHGS